MLGDQVGAALELVGITEARLSAWLGRPCGCSERREKLNALHLWARRAIRHPESSLKYLTTLTGIDSFLK